MRTGDERGLFQSRRRLKSERSIAALTPHSKPLATAILNAEVKCYPRSQVFYTRQVVNSKKVIFGDQKFNLGKPNFDQGQQESDRCGVYRDIMRVSLLSRDGYFESQLRGSTQITCKTAKAQCSLGVFNPNAIAYKTIILLSNIHHPNTKCCSQSAQ